MGDETYALRYVIAPTAAVILSWLCLVIVFTGCGCVIRRILTRSPNRGFVVADMWLGFVFVLLYLQFWSLFFEVSWLVWVAPLALAALGLASEVKTRRLRNVHFSIPVFGLIALATCWLANNALSVTTDYDLGLYHLNAIDYALSYATIPGLGNLHDRLGAGDAHLLFVASLEHGPWGHEGFHLANGLLVWMLFVDIASRFAMRPWLPRLRMLAPRMALLLVPATMIVVGIGPEYRLSSPNLDLATYVLVAVGALYLADCVEQGFRPIAAVTSTASFAAASATRPLYWITTSLAIGVLVKGSRHPRAQAIHEAIKTLIVVGFLPAAVLAGSLARQAILSGYPLFPSTIVSLPVDWRMPASVIHNMSHLDESWARWPGRTPATIGGSFHWLWHWARAQATNVDTMAPLALLTTLIPSLSVQSIQETLHEKMAARAVLFTVVPALIMWFLIAPDPRFALAPLWLVPITLVAWKIPNPNPPYSKVFLAGLGGASLVFVLLVRDIRWLVIATFDMWAGSTLVMWSLFRNRSRIFIAYAATFTALVVPLQIIATHGAFHVVISNHQGRFGTPVLPIPPVSPFRTASGLTLFKPTTLGSDQCWSVLLCTPQPNRQLRLRGRSIGSGFTVKPSPLGS